MLRARVQSLVGELRSCKPRGVAKKKNKIVIINTTHILCTFILIVIWPYTHSENTVVLRKCTWWNTSYSPRFVGKKKKKRLTIIDLVQFFFHLTTWRLRPRGWQELPQLQLICSMPAFGIWSSSFSVPLFIFYFLKTTFVEWAMFLMILGNIIKIRVVNLSGTP